MISISIILPTYNEAENIIPLIKEIEDEKFQKFEIIVVDDNSPDGTAGLVRKYISAHKKKNLKLLLRTKNRGLTNSIADGIKKAGGDVIVWMDCDFSHPPKEIKKLLKEIERGADIAVASRFVKGGGFIVPEGETKDSWLAIILSRSMNYLIQLLMGTQFKDCTSGFIACKKSVFADIKLRGDYGEYFIDLMYKAIKKGYRVREIPYIQDVRKSGESKTGQNIFQYIKRSRKYLWLTLQLLIEHHILKRF